MRERLQNLIGRLKAEQSGAVMLLLLAAFLILFMTTLVVYDAGRSAQDKMDVQFAADSAAYSHSVVKARGMNLIAYANTIKRMLFSYLAAYANAWIAIIVTWLWHARRCFNWSPCKFNVSCRVDSCLTWGAALPMIIIEGIELFLTNLPATAGGIHHVAHLWQLNETPSKLELMGLERYQQYINSVTPWWAYVEGTLRGMRNGAYIAGSWPPPTAQYAQINAIGEVANTMNAADAVFGTGFANSPASANVDALPAARRDRSDDNWNNPGEPYVYDDYGPDIFTGDWLRSGFQYCVNYAASLESLVSLAQVLMESEDDPEGWKKVFLITHLLPSLGCAFSAFVYNNFGYLDWRIPERLNDTSGASDVEWWQATSSLSVSYKPRAGRNSNSGERQKFTYMSNEAVFDQAAYANEGYFGMARSEIVYKQPFDLMNTFENWVNMIPLLGGFASQRLGLQDSPDLWSPRWKSKNRPVMLPGEQFGSVIEGSNVGFNTVTQDLLPWVALASVAGLIPGPNGGTERYGAASTAQDIAYLFRAGRQFGFNEAQGLAK